MIFVYPLHGVGSLSTATMVNWEGTRLILDCGPGAMTEIWRRGLRLRGLSGILLSHAHLDHLWGIPPLLWFLDKHNWRQEIKILYPIEIEDTILQLIKISGDPSFIRFNPLSASSKKCHVRKLIVECFSVSHPEPSCGFIITEPPKPRLDVEKLIAKGIPKNKWSAIAQGKQVKYKSQKIDPIQYLREARQRKIVYTGDTGPASDLITQARNADLVIIDASWVYPQWDPPEKAPHLTLRQAIEIAHRAKAERILFTHLTTRVSIVEYKKVVRTLQEEFKCSSQFFWPSDEEIEII